MKLIFLDIDGVLNNQHTKAKAPSGCTGIDNEKVKLLASIVYQTDAKIVLTSDWKTEWEVFDFCCSEDAKYLNKKLSRCGLVIVGKTYDDHVYDQFFEDRGKGIHDYLEKAKNVENYVVIDDHTFSDFDSEIMNHLVLTDYRTGLTEKNVERAIAIFLSKHY